MTDFELLTQSTKRWADFKLTMRNRSIEENAKLRDKLEGNDLSDKWFMCMRRLYGDSAPAIYCDWRPSVVKHNADHDKLLQVDDISWEELKKSQSAKVERLREISRAQPTTWDINRRELIKTLSATSLSGIRPSSQPIEVIRKPTVEERKLDIWHKKKY